MSRFYKSLRRLAVFFISSLGWLSIVCAQDILPYNNQAKAFPTSDNFVELRIQLASGGLFQVSQRNGGMIRIEKDGTTVGLTPIVVDKSRGIVSVVICEIIPLRNISNLVGESIIQGESFTLDKASPKSGIGKLAISVELEAINTPLKNDKSESRLKAVSLLPGPDGTCCVTCNGTKVCACAVTSSCGGCCLGDCCP